MSYAKSELVVVMKAKDLCRYVMTITQKSPKQYRFTFTTRMQNLAIGVMGGETLLLIRLLITFITLFSDVKCISNT